MRNDEAIARTLNTSFIDEPGRGEYKYKVFLVSGIDVDDVLDTQLPVRRTLAVDTTVSAFLFPVGECKVAVPGGNVPPPENLTCVNLNLPPRVDLVNAVGDSLVGPSDVLLVWQKPVEYDAVVITRNGDVVARIDGNIFFYIDRDVPAGSYTYGVSGIVGDQISRPATCDVNLPFPPIEPPSSLQCRFLGTAILDAKADFVDGVVSMSWDNNDDYDLSLIHI